MKSVEQFSRNLIIVCRDCMFLADNKSDWKTGRVNNAQNSSDKNDIRHKAREAKHEQKT